MSGRLKNHLMLSCWFKILFPNTSATIFLKWYALNMSALESVLVWGSSYIWVLILLFYITVASQENEIYWHNAPKIKFCLRSTFTIWSDFHKWNFWTQVLFKVWILYPIKRNTSKGRHTDIEDLKGKQSIV